MAEGTSTGSGLGKGSEIAGLGLTIIYIYLPGKLWEYYFTKGSEDQFCLSRLQSAAREVL